MSTAIDASSVTGRASRDQISLWAGGHTSPLRTGIVAHPVSPPSSRNSELARELIEECVLPDLLSIADELSASGVEVKVTVSDFEDPLVMRHASAAAWVTMEALPQGSQKLVVLGFAGKATDVGWKVEVFSKGLRQPLGPKPPFTEDADLLGAFTREQFEKHFLPYFCVR